MIKYLGIRGGEHMTKHIILWKLKDGLSEAERQRIKADAKRALEGLCGRIEGLTSVTVNTEPLPSSNCDMMLDSTFTCSEALSGYSVHPEHVGVANTYVRPYTAERCCFDFEL